MKPTGWEHLMNFLDLVDGGYLFILETNGILIGAHEAYAKDLSRFESLHVRVSLKRTCREELSRLTGALPEGFDLQIKALEYLAHHGVKCHPSCMTSFSPPERILALRKILKALHAGFEDIEREEIILYPAVEKRLRRMGIPYLTGHRPDSIPPEQI
jgi:uncharacterized Fe-S cluster-containing radical SAM superfamily protein